MRAPWVNTVSCGQQCTQNHFYSVVCITNVSASSSFYCHLCVFLEIIPLPNRVSPISFETSVEERQFKTDYVPRHFAVKTNN